MSKYQEVLKSRKFWASIFGLAASFGLYAGDEMATNELVNAIMVIVGAYTIGTGIESGLQNKE